MGVIQRAKFSKLERCQCSQLITVEYYYKVLLVAKLEYQYTSQTVYG
uniref:Uncharacterized protein n=1 Tax=Arundo donax TaxID=35708 RepID=A0A0A8YSD4_ARUDO